MTFQTNLTPFSRVIAATTNWTAASPCEGWAAVDVLNHVIDTQRDFFAEHGFDLGTRPDGDPAAVWRGHTDSVQARLADPATGATKFDGFFGPTTVAAALDTYYGFDLLVHRWDIARSQRVAEVFSDAELDAIEAAAESFGPALRMEGICGPAVDVPDGVSRQQQVMAFLGRDPR